ncbi:MAG: phenylacetic acid degradation operon negative regulatory protein PaaX [Pseudomonadota bacterium]|nr:phenylacetic acid degradation operon negative regulatory protein PaaX [Pseudomonadota bacterium]
MQPNLDPVARELTGRFRRQKPLRGGSLIVTVFGDALLPRGGAIALASLIRLAQPFGLNERLVRTASARLVQDGWLEARRVGKLGEYRLSDIGRERFAEATRRIYGEPVTPWTGRWTLILLPEVKGAAREKLRKELDWQGFGEISHGVFARPQSRSGQPAASHRGLKLPSSALIFDADLTADNRPASLVKLGWDLAALGKRYQRFVQRFERALASARSRNIDPEAAFIVRTLMIHEYRRLHLRDPLLPQRLLPAGWPGTRAAELCRELYGRLFTSSENHLSTQAALLSGPLPPAALSVLRRFGGLEPH